MAVPTAFLDARCGPRERVAASPNGLQKLVAALLIAACAPPADSTVIHSVDVELEHPATWGYRVGFAHQDAMKPMGLYLAPGQVATVTVPQAVVDYGGFKVLIGSLTHDNAVKKMHYRMDRVSVSDNVAGEKGGGLYLDGGLVFLRDQTALYNNTVQRVACDGELCGSSYYIRTAEDSTGAGRAFYALPAPPAMYLTLTSDCRASSMAAFAGICPPELRAHPELADAVVAELLNHAVDDGFPTPCPAGAYGVAGDVDAQRGNGCSGVCPAGYQCALQTELPVPCPRGTYCVEGSAQPTPCPGVRRPVLIRRAVGLRLLADPDVVGSCLASTGHLLGDHQAALRARVPPRAGGDLRTAG